MGENASLLIWNTKDPLGEIKSKAVLFKLSLLIKRPNKRIKDTKYQNNNPLISDFINFNKF